MYLTLSPPSSPWTHRIRDKVIDVSSHLHCYSDSLCGQLIGQLTAQLQSSSNTCSRNLFLKFSIDCRMPRGSAMVEWTLTPTPAPSQVVLHAGGRARGRLRYFQRQFPASRNCLTSASRRRHRRPTTPPFNLYFQLSSTTKIHAWRPHVPSHHLLTSTLTPQRQPLPTSPPSPIPLLCSPSPLTLPSTIPSPYHPLSSLLSSSPPLSIPLITPPAANSSPRSHKCQMW